MREMKKRAEKTAPSLLGSFKVKWADRRLRPHLIRYLLPIVFALLLAVTALLPIISFRTPAGESDAHSLLYWHTANFFGVDGVKGAYELMQLYGSGNAYYSFYRAVVVIFIVDAVAAVLGFLLTAAHSTTALYLLVTEEKSERSRYVGKLFRVVWGNRWTAMIPYALSVIPFAFPKIFSYASSALRSFDASAEFLLIDPLWIALAVLAFELLLLIRTRDGERGSRRNLFVPPELRETEKHEAADRETEEWEAAVRKDAEATEEIAAPSSHDAFRKEPKVKGDERETSESLHALFDDTDQDEK